VNFSPLGYLTKKKQKKLNYGMLTPITLNDKMDTKTWGELAQYPCGS
jgi:hypothetical protein